MQLAAIDVFVCLLALSVIIAKRMVYEGILPRASIKYSVKDH